MVISIQRGHSAAINVFDSLAAAIQELQASRPQSFIMRDYILAGRRVRLEAAGETLVDHLGAALAHLRTRVEHSIPAALHILAVDRAAFALPLVELPRHSDGGAEWSTGPHRFLASPDGRFVCHIAEHSSSIWCLDRKEALIVGVADTTKGLSLYERGKPFQPLLALWLDQGSMQMVHGAAVAWKGHAVMLAGLGGSGKSTAAVCCFRGGLEFLGDDYIALETRQDGSFFANSLFGSAWLEASHLQRFGKLSECALLREADGPKGLLLLTQLDTDRLLTEAPIRYLLLPEVNLDCKTHLSKAAKGDALRRLAPSCLFSGTRLGSEGFRTLTRLVESVDCHFLTIGPDLDAVAVQIKHLLEA